MSTLRAQSNHSTPLTTIIRVGITAMWGLLLLLPACTSTHQDVPTTAIEIKRNASPLLAVGYMLDVRVMASGVNEINEKGLRIQESGSVTLPLLGEVNAGGLTLGAFKTWLTDEYNAKYLINPIVSVNISVDDNAGAFPWGYVTVLGRIKEPGRVRIPPTRDLTIMQAIQQAGGFIKYAKEGGIEITRQERDGTSTRLTFDMRKMAKSSDEADIKLEHGDVVYVPEVIF
jgi:protein involved in polysaccharide export with SLBB domain